MFWTWQHSSTEVKKCTEVHLPGNSAVGTINLSATTVTGIGSTSLVLCLLYVYIWTLCQMSLCVTCICHDVTENNSVRIKCRLMFSFVSSMCFASKGRKMHYKTVFIMLPCKSCIYLHFVNLETEVWNEGTYLRWGSKLVLHTGMFKKIPGKGMSKSQICPF